MRDTLRKLTVAALCLALCLALAPVNARAEEAPGESASNAPALAVVDSGTCGDNLSWTLDDAGTLTITGAGAMTDWDNKYNTDNRPPWYSRMGEIQTVVIGSGVTSVGTYAFNSASTLTDVTIPGTVAAIGENAFAGCSGLTSVTLPSGVTSIGNHAFSSCSVLVSVSLPDTLTTIGTGAFSDCPLLSDIALPSSLTSLGVSAFLRCSSLPSIVIPEGITVIGGFTFNKCSSLAHVTLPSTLTKIGEEAFADCIALQELSLPDGQWLSIQDRAFRNCPGLTSLTIPGNVTLGLWSFAACSGLQSLVLCEGEAYIPRGAFGACTSLTYLRIPASMETCGGDTTAFNDCTGLKTAGPVGSGCNYEFAWTDKIAFKAFFGLTGLTDVTIPEGITKIQSWAFHDCTGLSELTFPSSVTEFGELVFEGCSGLHKVTLQGNMPTICTLAGYEAFKGITAEIHYPAGNSTYTADKLLDYGGTLTWIADGSGTVTYEVSYDANGGTGAPAAQTKTHGQPLKLSDAIPSRGDDTVGSYTVTFNANGGSCATASLSADLLTRYTFRNWNTKSDGSGTAYNAGVNYTTDAAVRLYAQWNSAPRIETITLPEATCEGYTFLGWGTSADATSGVTGDYTPAGDVTLWAVWERNTLPTYTVSYDANGGTGAPAAQTKTQGQPLTLSGTTPTRADASAGSFTVTLNADGGNVSPASLSAARTKSFTFKNWNTKANGSGTNYSAGGSYTADAAVTLYAQWNESTSTAAVTLPTPTRNGYTFEGWGVGAAAETGITGSFTPDGNVTLYALWRENAPSTFTVTCLTTNGSAGVSTNNAAAGTTVSVTNITPAGGCILQSITFTPAGGEETDITEAKSFTMPAADVVVKVVFRKLQFTDVTDPNEYFFEPVYWAYDKGITTGTTATTFEPYKTCTRGQIITFIWRVLGSPEPSYAKKCPFKDIKPSDYFYKPAIWCWENGINNGKTPTTFAPYLPCTREQGMAFLYRSAGNPPVSVGNKFKDVPKNAYYAKPVYWALENGITTGQTKTTFGVGNPCKRGQIMTFLYRYAQISGRL